MTLKNERESIISNMSGIVTENSQRKAYKGMRQVSKRASYKNRFYVHAPEVSPNLKEMSITRSGSADFGKPIRFSRTTD